MPGRRYFFVYLLTNATRRVLYTGVTRDLRRRVAQHRMGTSDAFTRRYRVGKLVWFEVHESMTQDCFVGPFRGLLAMTEGGMTPPATELEEHGGSCRPSPRL